MNFKLRWTINIPADEATLRNLQRRWQRAASAARDAASAYHDRARRIIAPEIVKTLALIGADPKNCAVWGVEDASPWRDTDSVTVIAESDGIAGSWYPSLTESAALPESLTTKENEEQKL